MPSKILYLDWIYGSQSDNAFALSGRSPLQEEIIEKVRMAMESLSAEEREFVQLYWYEGKRLEEIGELLCRQPSKLDALNRTIMRKLRNRLARYVAGRFRLSGVSDNCEVCSHPRKSEIDRLLLEKRPEETFRRTIATLRSDFNMTLSTPQILVGHMRYHMNMGR